MLAGDRIDLRQRPVVAAHAEDPVRDDDRALARGRGLAETRLQFREVEMTIDVPLARPRQADRVYNGVVIELVADDRSLRSDQGRQEPHHARVGRAEQHGRRSPMKGCERPLESQMRSPGAADEAHCAGTRPVVSDGGMLGGDHLVPQRKAQISIRIHPQERLVALALDQDARTATAARRQHSSNDGFVTFAAPFRLEPLELAKENRFNSFVRHRLFPCRSPAQRAGLSFVPSFSSISLVIAATS